MVHNKPIILSDRYRPGALAPVGDIFIKPESPSGSIFLPVGGKK
jgi:hypothetical protein